MAHVVIDGYNFIGCSKKFSSPSGMSLKTLRLKLAQQLSRYQQRTGHRVTVVFDATKTDHASFSEEKNWGIHFVYSAGGQTADEVIIDLAHRLREGIIVVSSDKQILHQAKKTGSGILTVEEFEQRMSSTFYENSYGEKKDTEKPRPLHKRWITKKKGPAKRLPKAKRRALIKL